MEGGSPSPDRATDRGLILRSLHPSSQLFAPLRPKEKLWGSSEHCFRKRGGGGGAEGIRPLFLKIIVVFFSLLLFLPPLGRRESGLLSCSFRSSFAVDTRPVGRSEPRISHPEEVLLQLQKTLIVPEKTIVQAVQREDAKWSLQLQSEDLICLLFCLLAFRQPKGE